MFTTTRTPVRIAAALALTAGLVAGAGVSAEAQGGRGEVRTSGSCSASTDWKLKAKLDDRRIEVEAEIDANRAGQVWRVRLADNGSTIFRGSRTTAGPSGSFSVERHTANRSGKDRITVEAVRPSTGERCSGVVIFTA